MNANGHTNRRQNIVVLSARQVLYQCLLMVRSLSGPFFTFVIPLMLLFVLSLVYGNNVMPTRPIRFPQFYTPSMVVFSVANACYVNLINGATIACQQGILKRIRGTPLPGWAYLLGRAGSTGVVAGLSATAVVIVGETLFDAQLAWSTLPGSIVMVVIGVLTFSMLALAMTRLVTSTDSALPVAYGTFLPVAFVSDVFFPSDSSPAWLRDAAQALPLRPMARTLEANMLTGARGLGFRWPELGIVAAWACGAAIAVGLTFRWEPSRPRTRRVRGPRKADRRRARNT